MGRVLWSTLFMAMACGNDDTQRTELVDVGAVCLRLQPTGVVRVEVTFRHCLTSCDTVRETSCTVKSREEGGRSALVVESRGSLDTSDASYCTASCGELRVSCLSAEEHAPGTYTVQHGDDVGELTLGNQPACLFAE
jgi:hypothetical protein